MNTKAFHETTAADTKSIGFDYQFYYFIYLLLQLKEGQVIGYEDKDDIHIEKDDGTLTLFQSKHSIGKEGKDEIGNLTERDSDLWKTIGNWINMINDPASGREEIEAQLAFISKTTFILVSNKQDNTSNKFLVNVYQFQMQIINLTTFRTYLQSLHDNTTETTEKPNPVKGYINKLLQQADDWLSMFLLKLKFNLDSDDLINDIKKEIKGKMVRETRVQDIYNALVTDLKEHFYTEVKGHKKFVITYDDFYKCYSKLFELGRTLKLPIRERSYKFPDKLEDQTFIKQLIDITDIPIDDYDSILEFTTCKLKMLNNIEEWLSEGDITSRELEEFKKDCILKWKNVHREAHRESGILLTQEQNYDVTEKLRKNAINCLDSVRKINLKLDETPLDTEMSNGNFYLLSDRPLIGWAHNWKEKYDK